MIESADRASLRDYLEGKPNHKINPIEAREIALSVCQGLDAVHRRGVMHRDIKPGNILLFAQTDGGTVAKLADFSIARVPKGWSDAHLTQRFGAHLTPHYASPEQLAVLDADAPEQIDTNEIDARSDLYSWALVFFEMLTGENPGDSLKDPSTFAVPDELPLTFFVARGIPSELAAILRRALYKRSKTSFRFSG